VPHIVEPFSRKDFAAQTGQTRRWRSSAGIHASPGRIEQQRRERDMVDPMYRKTEQGQQEIKTRARKLDHKLRALLLLVNGERRQSELIAQLGAMGIDDNAFDALLLAGMIETAAAMPGAAAPTTPHPHTAAPPATLSDGAYQRLYQFYTEAIGQHLGLRGYLLQVKVEKAGTIAELASLREALLGAVLKAKGEATAGAVAEELDELLGTN
jgi:hypothetical protein